MADDRKAAEACRRERAAIVVWERACKAGEAAVRKELTKAALQQLSRKAGPYGDLGVAIGALVAVGELIRVLTQQGDARVRDNLSHAYLRGALHGAETPLNADGSVYEGTPFDG